MGAKGLGRRPFVVAAICALAFVPALDAADIEPDHFRGTVVSVNGTSLALKTREGNVVRLAFPASADVFELSKATFDDVLLGSYVGSVAIIPAPGSRGALPRSSKSLLYAAAELRIIDESLRGIALGHRRWDLAPDTIMAHGWIDDLEVRVISIKYGPTDDDETDVEIPSDVPIQRMSTGQRGLVKQGAMVFAGARKGPDGAHVVEYIIVGKDGVTPAL
jgi:hypothetical protein